MAFVSRSSYKVKGKRPRNIFFRVLDLCCFALHKKKRKKGFVRFYRRRSRHSPLQTKEEQIQDNMFSAAARHLVRRGPATSTAFATRAVAAPRPAVLRTTTSTRAFASLEQYDDYGKNVFSGKVAEEYLSKQGASGDILKDPTWVAKHSDVVAQAVFEWYVLSLLLSLVLVVAAGCCVFFSRPFF
jgi:hypothetical protein